MQLWDNITTFFSAENYTLFVVSLASGILCFAAGVVGTFTYLRKRALIGDVISHSVLPGVAIAFMLTGVKNPGYFLLGAISSGLLSIWIVDYVQAHSKLKPDAILALTLSVFFGVGIVLLTKIQHSGVAEIPVDHRPARDLIPTLGVGKFIVVIGWIYACNTGVVINTGRCNRPVDIGRERLPAVLFVIRTVTQATYDSHGIGELVGDIAKDPPIGKGPGIIHGFADERAGKGRGQHA